jgi:hypothetical protein
MMSDQERPERFVDSEGMGTDKARTSPPVSGEDQHDEETQHPAPAEDTGVPEDAGDGPEA